MPARLRTCLAAALAVTTPLAAAPLVLAGCPAPAADVDAGPAELDCGGALVALVRVPGGGYLPLADAGAGVELVLGFQGFRYLYARAHLDRDPGDVPAAAILELDDGSPRSQPLLLTFSPDATGAVSAAVQLFFNDDPLPTLVDHGLTLELRLGPRCTARGHTVLRYDPSCIEGPDGQPVCDRPDAGVDGGR